MDVSQRVRNASVATGVIALVASPPAAYFWSLRLAVGLSLIGLGAGVVSVLFAPSRTDDCGQLSPSERLSVAGIWIHSSLRQLIQWLLRPGAWITVIAVAVYGLLQLSRQVNTPEIWGKDSNWYAVLVITAIPALMGSLLVSIGYPRLLSKTKRKAALEAICQDAAVLAADELSISHKRLAAHVWQIRGIHGAHYLDCIASYRPHSRGPTFITWRKGKGALGACWDEEATFVADVEDLDLQIATGVGDEKKAFCDLDPDIRFRLSWNEYRRVRHYRSVLVTPLRGGRPGKYAILGILSLGVLVDAKATDLYKVAATETFGDIVKVCQDALAKTPAR